MAAPASVKLFRRQRFVIFVLLFKKFDLHFCFFYRNTSNDRLSYDTKFADSRLESLGISEDSVMSKVGAQTSLSRIDNGLKRVNEVRSTLGAMQNRLSSTVSNLAIYDENLSAANSRIRDTDIAEESSELVKQQILQQAGVAVLGHANSSQQMALKLLG